MENTNSCKDFFRFLLQSPNIAIIAHQKGLSLAKHEALNDYYDKIIKLNDKLLECYQGCYGILELTIPESTYHEPIEYLRDLKDYILDSKDSLFEYSFLLNIIDEILALISRTLYRLLYL